jgi:hypothetical protein
MEILAISRDYAQRIWVKVKPARRRLALKPGDQVHAFGERDTATVLLARAIGIIHA